MTENKSAAGAPFLTIWDGVTALLVGIICFVMSLVHQEELWVALLSGFVTAVVMLILYPLIRRFVNRPGGRWGGRG